MKKINKNIIILYMLAIICSIPRTLFFFFDENGSYDFVLFMYHVFYLLLFILELGIFILISKMNRFIKIKTRLLVFLSIIFMFFILFFPLSGGMSLFYYSLNAWRNILQSLATYPLILINIVLHIYIVINALKNG